MTIKLFKTMKRITLLMIFAMIATVTFAQTKSNSAMNVEQMTGKPVVKTLSTKAIDDTLCMFDGYYWYVNPTDQTNFGFQNEDLDQNIPAQTGWDSDFLFFYTTNTNDYDFRPWDVDTAFFCAASSWFTPAGQADNWFEFGPITVPATGAELSWEVKANPAYTDGYEVLLSTTGMNNYSDFTNSAIYSRPDNYPAPDSDTLWAHIAVPVPSAYAGQQIYVAFHHTANDMDVLWLDEMVITEKNNIGVAENAANVNVSQNYPNPAVTNTNINVQLEAAANVSIDVYDMAGRNVIAKEYGMLNAGTNMITLDVTSLNSGTYVYTVTVDGQKFNKQMFVK